MKLKTLAGAIFAGAAAAMLFFAAPAQASNSGGPGDDGSTQKGLVAVDDTIPLQICNSKIPIGGVGLVGVQVTDILPLGSPAGNGACSNNGSSADKNSPL